MRGFLTIYLFIIFTITVNGDSGICGPANGVVFADSLPSNINSSLCDGKMQWSAVKVLGPDVTWTCYKNGTGNNTNCMAHIVVSLQGLCGYARHQNLTNKSLLTSDNEKADLCVFGTPANVSLFKDFQFQWTCLGTGTGKSMTCTANYTPYSCDGRSNGATFSTVVSYYKDVSKLCIYGPGNYSVLETKSVNLRCTGSVAEVVSEIIQKTESSGVCDPRPSDILSLSVLGNWRTDPAKGGYRNAQVVNNRSIYSIPEFDSPRGIASAQVTVNPGDDPINSSGERSEVLSPLSLTTLNQVVYEYNTSGTVYFAISYKFPENFGGVAYGGKWSIIFQLHGPDIYRLSPSFAFSAGTLQSGGTSAFSLDGNGGFVPAPGGRGTDWSGEDTERIYPNRWTEFILRVSFSVYNNGSATVWRRNEGEKTFRLAIDVANAATLQTQEGQPVGTHYWKQGLYRHKGDNRTDVFYMGPMARAATFSDAERAAFGTNYGTTVQPTDPGDTFASPSTSSSSSTSSSPTSTTTGNDDNSCVPLTISFTTLLVVLLINLF